MPQSRTLRFSLFGLLYFTQGTVLGYFSALNALYLLANGLNMVDVGIFSTIALIPFVIKILFGLLSDRFNFFGLGHRKPYIVIGLLVQFICLIVVAWIDPGRQYWGFVALAFLLQMGMAFYDTCTDGLALDVTPIADKGILQGFMVGGRSIGVIAAAAIAGRIAETSWPGVFYFLAALTLLPIPLLFFVREVGHTGERFQWTAFSAFKQRDVLAAAGMGLVIFLVIAGANQLFNPSLDARVGISTSTAGLITTVWGIGCVAGALCGGWVMDRIGDKATLRISLAAIAVAMVFLAIIQSMGMAFAGAVIFGLAYGSGQAIYFALAMKYTRPEIAASMYSILMAVTNVGQGIGMGVGGALSVSLGYPTTFIIYAALLALALPLFPVLFRKRQPVQRISVPGEG